MFQSSINHLRAWWGLVDDLLGDPRADAHLDKRSWATHPHRRPLRWQRERRAGSLPAAPAHCLCPVLPARGVGGRDEVPRQPMTAEPRQPTTR
jgi:hypothetical protein